MCLCACVSVYVFLPLVFGVRNKNEINTEMHTEICMYVCVCVHVKTLDPNRINV